MQARGGLTTCPWCDPSGLDRYVEYFQWQPETNWDSQQGTVNAGDILFATVDYDKAKNAYNVFHSSSSGWSVKATRPIQKSEQRSISSLSMCFLCARVYIHAQN